MKNIKSLEDFNEDSIFEAVTPENAKFVFSITSNQKKVSRIKKTLIDIHQLLTEMNDEVLALKLTYENLDSDSSKIVNNMQSNINKMMLSLKEEEGKGMIANSGKLERNLEALKSGVVKKKKSV